jgi:hypothetical protein
MRACVRPSVEVLKPRSWEPNAATLLLLPPCCCLIAGDVHLLYSLSVSRGPETQIPSVRLSKSGFGFHDLDRRTD